MNPFFERYRSLYADDFSRYERTTLPTSIWVVNSFRDIGRRLPGCSLSPISFSPRGYTVIRSPYSIGATPLYLLGYYIVQEAAAQFPALVLDPKPGDLVVDMCAAPGMKTVQLATLMQNKGAILACEKKKERLHALCNNLERCGIMNCIVLERDALHLTLHEKADKVLLDAPCSGNFLTDKTWLQRRKVSDFRKMAGLQKELLRAGISVLKSGGVLVYSTCSLEPEEDEEVIRWALDALPVFLEPVHAQSGVAGLMQVFGKKLSGEMEKTWHFLPPSTQGFFVAKMRKK